MAAPVPGRASIAGVILAGGRGRRMGGADKGWVAHEGRPLVEHVLERFAAQVGELLISANRNLERYRRLGYPVVSDDSGRFGEFAGPLAGMFAGLQAARLPWTAFVPCDAPLLPRDLVAALAEASAGGRPAFAISAAGPQPVFCLLPAALAPRLADALLAGEHRPREFLRSAGAVEVSFEDAEAFRNINSPAGAGGASP